MGRHNNLQNLRIAAAATSTVIFLLLLLWSFTDQFSSFPNPKSDVVRLLQEPTFYDEPTDIYTMDTPMVGWDRKRSRWFDLHPAYSPTENRVLLITGSQPSACRNPLGDHFLLRFFKNKVDYCRIHGHDIFYNNAHMHPKMPGVWTKLPGIRAAMVAHPEAEWVFWLDSDAVFTDMEFRIPFERYEGHNLVIHGWPGMLRNRSWLGVNTGAFYLRNCQASMELLDAWAGLSPKSPGFREVAETVRSTLTDMHFPVVDDQCGLVYLMLEGDRRWRDMIYLETGYVMNGYWRMLVGGFDVGGGPRRRRRAEAVSGGEEGAGRRPFVTHFTGCQPCSGEHNPAYEGDSCTVAMERALNFADNQVLENYGFVHPDLGDSSLVTPLPSELKRRPS